MKRTKIITHYGKAHRDEFLACCVVFFNEYRHGRLCFVERRVATQTDLASPTTWVIDTGNEYAPERLNFDHHHFPTEMCALDMVLLHILGEQVYNSYRAVSPWLKSTSLHDNGGAKVAADKLGMDLHVYMSTKSPIEKFVLDRFAETMVIHCDTHLALLMRDIGRMIVAGAEHLHDELPNLISNTPSPVDHFGLRLWDIRSVQCDEPTCLAILNQAAFSRGVDLMISSTGRSGGGVGIYRQSWAKAKIDLSLVKDHPLVKFAHKNGYYAVTISDVDDADLLKIIAAATESPPNHHTSIT